jgi:hypothetical protein
VKRWRTVLIGVSMVAVLLLAIQVALPPRPTVPLAGLIAQTPLLPDPWRGFPLTTDIITPQYSYGSVQNVSTVWAETVGLWPSFDQWILEYPSPFAAAYAFSVSMPLGNRSEPGIRQYTPNWRYESPYGDQARTNCTDVGTGVPVVPEGCRAYIRYGQYVLVITIFRPPVDESSFLSAIAVVDRYVGEQLRRR